MEDRGANGKVENFTGSDGQSAVRWLRRFTRERVTRKDGSLVTAPVWLEEIDGHLGREAERWADCTPAIRNLLNENTLDKQTAESITMFKKLFLDHFQVETVAPFENAIPQIQSLCQMLIESLLIYHRQALGLLIAAGGKDIPGTGTVPHPLEPSVRSILDLAIDRYINGLSNMQLRLRMLRYVANPNRSLRGAYMVAEVETKQMLAEKDLLYNMKSEKKLELWRRMKTTMKQSNGNTNSSSVLALLSQIKMVVAEEEDPLSKFKLDNNPSSSSQSMTIISPNVSTSSYQAGQLREVQNPNPPVDPRVTEIKDFLPSGPPGLPSRNQSNSQPFSTQSQWQGGNYQGGNKSGSGYYQRPKPPYDSPDWRANSGPRIFDPSKSLNPYINGSRVHRYSSDNPLCFKCGIPGHKSMDQQCTSPSLSYGEQLYLKQMIFDDIQKLRGPGPTVAQSNMARAEFIQDAEYDDPQDILPLSVGPFVPDGKGKEKARPDLRPENCEPSVSSYQGTVRVELEDGTLKDVELSSLIDITGIKRRRMRPEKPTVEDDIEEFPQRDILPSNTYTTADGRKKLSSKGKGLGKKKKALAQIVGMIGESEVDMRKVLMGTNVVLPLLQQMQISPWFRDELSRLGRAPRKPRKAQVPVDQSVPIDKTGLQSEPTAHQAIVDKNSYSVRKLAIQFVKDMAGRKSMAYGINVVTWNEDSEKKLTVNRSGAMADQGSDINMAYPKLIQQLGLVLYPVSKLGVRSLTMHTSDGSKVALTHWVKFHTEVSGLYRHVWAFVAPHSGGPLSLLLGLPWLESVDAVFKIRDEELMIGDKTNDEQVRVLKNPDLSKQHSVHLEISDKDSSEDEESSGDEEEEGDENGASDTDSESEDEMVASSTRVTFKDQVDFC